MRDKIIRWGILAVGNIAGTFAEALQDAPGSVLHAVAGRDIGRAEAFAQKHGAQRCYGSYQALLADSEVDAVYIATIHPLHLEWILHALHAGKHVLCEKPLTMNLREAKRAQKVASAKGRLLREAFMYRHHPQIQQVVDLVSSGVLGRVQMIESSFCFNAGSDTDSRFLSKALGGGGILDVGCYPLSAARLIAGRAQGRLFSEPLELKAVGHLGVQEKVDLWSSAVLRFEGDVLAKLTCSIQSQEESTLRISGERGELSMGSPWCAAGQIQLKRDQGQSVEVFEPDMEKHFYAYEIETFTNELRGQPIGPQAVGMRFDDTLGNMRALDWWRSEIGLGYEADRVR